MQIWTFVSVIVQHRSTSTVFSFEAVTLTNGAKAILYAVVIFLTFHGK
jgi:peroxiredoxin family protein